MEFDVVAGFPVFDVEVVKNIARLDSNELESNPRSTAQQAPLIAYPVAYPMYELLYYTSVE